MHSARLPGIGINVVLAFGMRGNLVATVGVPGRIDNARVVPAVRQNERDIGIGQQLHLVH